MGTYKEATLMLAARYVELLSELNDKYLSGGDHQLEAIYRFDLEYLNLSSIRQKIANLAMTITAVDSDSEADYFILDTCNTLVNIGAHLINQRLSLQERILWLKDALSASRILKIDSTTQAHLGNLGLAYYELGDTDIAIKYLTEALTIASQIKDLIHQGAWLGNLGMVHAFLGERELAINSYEQSLVLARKSNDFRGQSHALENLGAAFASIGKIKDAQKCYRKSIRFARAIKDYDTECANLINLGRIYHDLGKIPIARWKLRQASHIAEKYQKQDSLDLILVSRADIDIDQGNYNSAIRDLQARICLDEFNKSVEMEMLQSLGNAYLRGDQFSEAEAVFLRLLSIAEAVRSKVHIFASVSNLTCVYRYLGQYDKVCSFAQQGLLLAEELGLDAQREFIVKQLDAQGIQDGL
jgi:tetratricopeptide (TPR) repeat protein